jgi:hypothetical protein
MRYLSLLRNVGEIISPNTDNLWMGWSGIDDYQGVKQRSLEFTLMTTLAVDR